MKQPPAEVDTTTRLALERTRIAQERTLLAWVRTAIALITFGFSIYGFFAIESGAGHRLVSYSGARSFALALIVVGFVSLLLATIQHRRDQATLRTIDPSLPSHSQALLLGAFIAVVGLLALILVLFHSECAPTSSASPPSAPSAAGNPVFQAAQATFDAN